IANRARHVVSVTAVPPFLLDQPPAARARSLISTRMAFRRSILLPCKRMRPAGQKIFCRNLISSGGDQVYGSITRMFSSPEELADRLRDARYVIDDTTLPVIYFFLSVVAAVQQFLRNVTTCWNPSARLRLSYDLNHKRWGSPSQPTCESCDGNPEG